MLGFIRNNLLLFLLLFLLLCAPQFVVGAFKFVVILVIILFVVATIGLLLFRWRMASIVDEMNGAAGGGKAREGSETLGTNKSKSVSKDVGDYVDFEDIKE